MAEEMKDVDPTREAMQDQGVRANQEFSTAQAAQQMSEPQAAQAANKASAGEKSAQDHDCVPGERIAGETEQDADANPAHSRAGEISELDQALLEVAQLKEQLARRNADLYNVQQEYANYVKRSKLEAQGHKEAGVQKVLELLLSVLDNAALAREHDELVGPAGKVVEELENTLRTNFQLERYGAVGDEFDPMLHDALIHQTSAEVEKEEISVLIQAGYKQGEKVLRPARVGVSSPA